MQIKFSNDYWQQINNRAADLSGTFDNDEDFVDDWAMADLPFQLGDDDEAI